MARDIRIDAAIGTVRKSVETRKPGVKVLKGQPMPAPDSTVDMTVDFSGCTQDDILELASRSVIISWQDRLRRKGTDVDWSATVASINVKAELDRDRERAPADPKTSIVRQLSKMDPAEAEAYLKQLIAERKKNK